MSGRGEGRAAVAALAAAGAALLLAQGGAAQGKNPLVEKGIKQYNDLEYEQAIETFTTALNGPEVGELVKVELYKYLGMTYLVLEREAEAEGAFRNLLMIDESFAFDPVTTSPKVTAFFQKAREKWVGEGKPGGKQDLVIVKKPVNIYHKIPERAVKDQDLNLKIEVENPQKGAVSVEVQYRDATSQKFTAVKASLKDASLVKSIFIATIPADQVQPPVVEYYVEVFDHVGNLVSTKGDASVPLRVPVPEKANRKKALLWGLVGGGAGVVALALAIAIPLALRDGGDETVPPGKKGSITIVLCEAGSPGC